MKKFLIISALSWLLQPTAVLAQAWECNQWGSKEYAEATPLGVAFYRVGVTRLLGVKCSKHAAQAPPADVYEHHDAVLLPNHHLTPGVIALTDTKQICAKKWGKDARSVTAAMKAEVYAEYGQKPRAGLCAIVSHKNKAGELVKNTGCEIDHLVSRELGGADDVKNLWPQPYLTPDQPGAYQKDKLENRLHVLVCTDKMGLADAQACITNDWAACYTRAFGAVQ